MWSLAIDLSYGNAIDEPGKGSHRSYLRQPGPRRFFQSVLVFLMVADRRPRVRDPGFVLHTIDVNSVIYFDGDTVALNHFGDVCHPNWSGKIHGELKVRSTFLEAFSSCPTV